MAWRCRHVGANGRRGRVHNSRFGRRRQKRLEKRLRRGPCVLRGLRVIRKQTYRSNVLRRHTDTLTCCDTMQANERPVLRALLTV